MVVSLGPGKFYGSSLPRPRLYNDVKLNPERVDPPAPVLDPLLSWASEAHWSMGGLSFKRLRLQGRIEGNVNKLRAELKKKQKNKTPIRVLKDDPKWKKKSEIGNKRYGSFSPPPAPIAVKRRRYTALIDESEEEEVEEEEVRVEKKKPVRKLYDEFDKVAKASEKNEKAAGSRKGSAKDSFLQRTTRGVEDEDNGGIGEVIMSVVAEVNRENDVEVKKIDKKSKKKSGEVQNENGTRVSSRHKKGVEKENASSGANSTRVSPRLAKRGQ